MRLLKCAQPVTVWRHPADTVWVKATAVMSFILHQNLSSLHHKQSLYFLCRESSSWLRDHGWLCGTVNLKLEHVWMNSWIRGGFPSTLWSQCSDLYWVYMSSLLIIRLNSAWCLTCICPFTSAPGCLSLLVHPQKLFMTYRLGLQRYHFIQTEYEYFHLCACRYWVLITIFLPQK